MDLAAQIAARYGASVAPGVTVQRVPMGQSARPLPVWDAAKNKLITPDWQDQLRSRKTASVRQSQAAARKTKAEDAAALQKVIDLHGAGATNANIARACGISESYCRSILSRNGLVAHRDPAHQKQSGQRRQAARIAAQKGQSARRSALILSLVDQGADLAAIARATGLRNGDNLRRIVAKLAPAFAAALRGPSRAELRDSRIRALVAEGAGVERIGAALGVKDGRHLRRLIRRAVPGFATLPNHQTDLAERDRLVVQLYPTTSKPVMAEKLGLTLSQVTAAIRRARAAGLLPSVAEAAPPKRQKRRLKGIVYHGDRNARILDLQRQGATIEAIMADTDLTRDRVARVLWAAGESVRNARSSAAAQRVSELPDLIAQGLHGQAIADRWGVTLATVYQIAHRAGVSLTNRAKPHNRGEVTPEVAARRELVRNMVLRGVKQADMLPILKISHATLSTDIKALGLSGQSLYAQPPRKAKAPVEAEAQRRAA